MNGHPDTRNRERAALNAGSKERAPTTARDPGAQARHSPSPGLETSKSKIHPGGNPQGHRHAPTRARFKPRPKNRPPTHNKDVSADRQITRQNGNKPSLEHRFLFPATPSPPLAVLASRRIPRLKSPNAAKFAPPSCCSPLWPWSTLQLNSREVSTIIYIR